MARAKASFKDQLIEKGERFALFGAVGLMLLLLGFGVYVGLTSKSTEMLARDMKAKADMVKGKTQNNPAIKPPDLNPVTKDAVVIAPVEPTRYLARNAYFSASLGEDSKRRNPNVLAPNSFQLDAIRAQVRSYLMEPGRGKDDPPTLFVIKQAEKKVSDTSDLAKKVGKLKKKPFYSFPGMGPGLGGMGSNLGMLGGPGFAGMGGMPNPMGMAGVPGAIGAIGAAGGMAGFTGIRGGPNMGSFTGTQFNPNAAGELTRIEANLEPVSLDKLDKLGQANVTLAETIQPKRLVVIHADFPYRKQVEEFARALRFNSVDDLLKDPDVLIQFRGFDVQRKVTAFDGTVIQDWKDYDWQAVYRPVMTRSVDKLPDPLELAPVLTPPSHRLVMPLPQLVRGQYPDVRLETITSTLKAIAEATQPKTPIFKTDRDKKLSGTGDIFGEDEPMDTPKPEEPAQPQTTELTAQQLPEFILVRFVDANVQPGFAYEYRIRVKMANPNYEKKELVAFPKLADVKELAGPWAECEQGVVIPYEDFLYADLKKGNPRAGIPDQPVLQFHRWYEEVRVTDDSKNGIPVGDWVIADSPVKPGEFIGQKVWVELPTWSPTKNAFILRENPSAPKLPKRGQPEIPKGGVQLDLATEAILVDAIGGTASAQPGKNKPLVKDESGVELLMLTPDGRLLVRSSAVDAKDADRKKRLENWNAWVNETKNRPDTSSPTKKPEDPFKAK